MLGKIEGQKKWVSKDEMAGWHHQQNGHELGQTLGDGEGQRDLACCSPWGHKESDTTGQLNKNSFHIQKYCAIMFHYSGFIVIDGHIIYNFKYKKPQVACMRCMCLWHLLEHTDSIHKSDCLL